MSRNLSASDRSSLIKLASSLPAGSEERKAILAGLTKISYDYSLVEEGVAPPKGKLQAWLYHGDVGGVDRSHVGKKIWQGTISASQAEELTKGLETMAEYADMDFDRKLEDIEERIRELGYEKEEILLNPLHQKAQAVSKKWGLPLSSDGQIYMNNSLQMHDSQGRAYEHDDNSGWTRDGNLDLKKRAILAGLKKVSSDLTPEMAEVALMGDPKAFAALLDAKYGKDADFFLDDMGGQIREVFENAGLQVGKFRQEVSTALMKMSLEREKAEIAASPWKKELGVLKDVTTRTITPSDVRRIQYQPKTSKGVIVSAILEDLGGSLGNFRASVNEADASQGGTTLKRVFMCLENLGAKLVTRGMGPGKPKPWINYDGWAY